MNDVAARAPTSGPVEIQRLQEKLGHQFANPRLIRLALTHASASEQEQANNERLEFLGDRVLGLVVAEMLLERFPHEKEGDLAKRHAALVRRQALAEVARRLQLGDYLIVSGGEQDRGLCNQGAVLSDCCEAVIAALYLDGGLTIVEKFIREHWAKLLRDSPNPPQDAKTGLQEWALKRGLGLPEYRMLARSGPDHKPMFHVSVQIGHDQAEGDGGSKRDAEQVAAARLMALLTQQESSL